MRERDIAQHRYFLGAGEENLLASRTGRVVISTLFTDSIPAVLQLNIKAENCISETTL